MINEVWVDAEISVRYSLIMAWRIVTRSSQGDLTVIVPPRTWQCTAETSSQVHDPRRQIHSKTQRLGKIVAWNHVAHRVHRRGTR